MLLLVLAWRRQSALAGEAVTMICVTLRAVPRLR